MRMHLLGDAGWDSVIVQLERESKGWRRFLPWLACVPLQKRGVKCNRSDFLRILKIILALSKKGQQETIDDLDIVSSHNHHEIPEMLLVRLDRQRLLRTGLVDDNLKLSQVDQRIVNALIGGGIDSFSGLWDPWESLCQRVHSA